MKLVSFETISELLPIEGADRIELARIQGWQSVVKKGEYKVGDRVIFIPIDTMIAPAVWNQFLWDKKDPTKPIRIKTAKLRGAISQGVIFPTTLISAQEIWDHYDDPDEDVSLAGMLGVTKYEKPIPANLAGKVKCDFPTHLVSKTDEDNLKSNIQVLAEFEDAETIEATLKIDGTSATYIKEVDGTFRVCSRNLELYDGENVYWQMARKYNIQEILQPGYSIQGEIAGPGIQKNPAGFSEVGLYLFNMVDLATRKPVNKMNWINGYGVASTIPGVPVIKIFNKNFDMYSIDDLQKWVNGIQYPNSKPAEGIVFRAYNKAGELMYSKTLQKMLSVKIINQNYID
jgi:RNA ligase (TIGR02306 family)